MPGRDPNAAAFSFAPSARSVSDDSSGPSAATGSQRTRSSWSFSRPEARPSPVRLSDGESGIDHRERYSDIEHDEEGQEAGLTLGPPLMGENRRPSQGESTHIPFFPSSYSETQGSIRDDTALLSDMLLSPSAVPSIHLGVGGSPPTPGSFGPLSRGRPATRLQLQTGTSSWAGSLLRVNAQQPPHSMPSHDEEAASSFDRTSSSSLAAPSKENNPVSPMSAGRSMLTMLLERERMDSSASDTTVIAREATASTTPHSATPDEQDQPSQKPTSTSGSATPDSSDSSGGQTPTPRPSEAAASPQKPVSFPSTSPGSLLSSSSLSPALSSNTSSGAEPRARPPTNDTSTRRRVVDVESTPLLGRTDDSSVVKSNQAYSTFLANGEGLSFSGRSTTDNSPPHHIYTTPSNPPTARAQVASLVGTAKHYASPKAFATGVTTTLEAIPSVLLGLLLNILDGVSYGFIIFPAGPVFAGFGSMGVSMFFVTTVISQLVYTFGGSSFSGATASMIIEVIPFFHMMAADIVSMLGEENQTQIVATVMVAFALSSILTGLAFLTFGLLELGSIIGFFPRHILVGCIGGVGVFLIQTGLSVCAGLGEEDSDLTWKLLKLYFTDSRILTLWVPAFVLAAMLRVITHRYHHQLIFPAYFVALPIIFYCVVLAGGYNVSELRETGWVFNVGEARDPWWKFYTMFDFRQTSWRAIWATMPTQLALLFFNVLHPPLNVPALGVSLGKDEVNLSRELTGHGISNLVAGALGVPSNYLAYVNTLLFYRVGGTTRYAGFLLALATFGLLLIGTGPIAYIPVIEVGALIFVLGIDLVKEAIWDTWPRTSSTEYFTIISIMLCMTVYDFVSGVLFGIILASIFFVIQNSRRHSIRNIYSGATALSPVRRPSAHRKYLQEVGTQTCIMILQGHLFFGTISKVEERCRAILDQHAWERNPIRFLVIDLALVGGLDISAAEAFVRVHRLLVAKRVILVFCGQPPDTDVATALQAVGMWSGNVQTFAVLNEALEWTENAYLRAWYASPGMKNESPPRAENQPIANRPHEDPLLLAGSFVNSPRRNHVVSVGTKIMDAASAGWQDSSLLKEQPFNTIIKTFSAHASLDNDFISRIVPYFKAQVAPEGEVVYRQGEQADGLYLIEAGVLRATYSFADEVPDVVESCVAGTLSGELTALAGEPRNATVVAERQSVLWKVSIDDLNRMQKDQPDDANLFIKLVLKTAKIDQDVLLTNLAQFRM